MLEVTLSSSMHYDAQHLFRVSINSTIIDDITNMRATATAPFTHSMMQDVENFPGFPEGIHGTTLCDRFREQSVKFGTTVIDQTITSVDFTTRPFRLESDSACDVM